MDGVLSHLDSLPRLQGVVAGFFLGSPIQHSFDICHSGSTNWRIFGVGGEKFVCVCGGVCLSSEMALISHKSKASKLNIGLALRTHYEC